MKKPLLLLLLLTLLGSATRRVQAEDSNPPETPGITLNVSAGLDGQCRQNAWMPVWVTVQNDAQPLGRVSIEIAFGDDTYRLLTDLPPNSRKSFETFVMASWQSKISVRLKDGEEILAKESLSTSCGTHANLYIGLWSADTRTAAAISPPADTGGGGTQYAFLSANDLPSQAIGLEALDLLVLGADSDTRTLSQAQLEALRQWTLAGGNLLLFGGGNWTYALGLEEVLPFHPHGSTVLPSLPEAGLAALESPLTLATGRPAEKAHLLTGSAATPLLLSRPLGRGQVFYTTFDPRSLPVETAWELLAPMWKTVAAQEYASSQPILGNINSLYDGYEALHILPSLTKILTPLLGLLVGVYILSVGPLNFILLRRHREWLWGSSLLISFLFTLGILAAGTSLRGRPLANQLFIVRTWPEADTARVNGLLGIYSPRRGTYTYQADTDLWAYPLETLSWVNDYPHPVVEHAGGRLRFPDVHMDTSDMIHLGIAAFRPAPHYQGDLSMQVAASSQAISLRGVLLWEEDFPLQDAVLIWGDTWNALGDIQPGTETELLISSDTDSLSSDQVAQVLLGERYYYSASDPVQEQRDAMLSALLEEGAFSNGRRAVVAGWSDARHGLPLQWQQDGSPIGLNGQTLYLISLPINHERPEGQAFSYRTLVPQHLYEHIHYPEPEGGVGNVVLAQIPLEMPQDSFLSHLAIVLDVNTTPPNVPVSVEMWNYRTRKFEACTTQGDEYLPPGDPQDYLTSLGQYRLHLLIPQQVDYLDIFAIGLSLEFAPLP